MTNIVDKLKSKTYVITQGDSYERWDGLLREASNEIERLRKYEKLVQFISNDYYELSYDKVKWQHNDWYKRCRKLIQEDLVSEMAQADSDLI